MKETDLYQPVKEWLKQYGLEVHPEVQAPYRGSAHDIVAIRGVNRLPVIVELKLSFSRGLAHQCAGAMYASPFTYAASLGKPSVQFMGWAEGCGFGVILVGDEVKVLKKPRMHWRFNRLRAKRLYAAAHARGDSDKDELGGRPTQKGTGPAWEVVRRVVTYLEKNPDGTWAEVFENVPNHYAHSRSMRGAIRKRVLRKLVETQHEKKDDSREGG